MDNSSLYNKYLLRSRSTRNHFIFCRDWLILFKRDCALFIQDVINRAALKKSKHRTMKWVDGVERDFFLCTTKYLREKSLLRWSDNEQKVFLKELRDRGFVYTINKGQPPKRWISIDILAIEKAIDAAMGETKSASDVKLDGVNLVPINRVDPGERKVGVGEFSTDQNGEFSTELITNKNGHNEERTHTHRRSDERGLLLKPHSGTESKEQRWAKLLWDAISSKRLLNTRRSRFQDWIKCFEKLRTKGPKDGPIPTDEEIERCLQALIPNISLGMENQHWPVVHSARAFCEKFHQLRLKVNREEYQRYMAKSSSQTGQDLEEELERKRQANTVHRIVMEKGEGVTPWLKKELNDGD